MTEVPSPAVDSAVVSVEDVEALRALIFAADDLQAELVVIPEWGDLELEVRSMTGHERAAYLVHMQSLAPNGDMTKIDWKGLYPSLLAATVFAPARDADGRWVAKSSDKKVFRADDVDRLNAKNSKPVERIAKVAQRLSALNDEDIEA